MLLGNPASNFPWSHELVVLLNTCTPAAVQLVPIRPTTISEPSIHKPSIWPCSAAGVVCQVPVVRSMRHKPPPAVDTQMSLPSSSISTR